MLFRSVQNVQQSLISAKAQEEVNGTLEILRSAEWAFFNGNATAHPSEFDGLPAIILANGTSDQVIDCGGKPLSFLVLNNGAEVMFSEGHYGIPTDLYVSPLAQADLDAGRLVTALDIATAVDFAYYVVHPKTKGRLPQVKAFVNWLKTEADLHEASLRTMDVGAGI